MTPGRVLGASAADEPEHQRTAAFAMVAWTGPYGVHEYTYGPALGPAIAARFPRRPLERYRVDGNSVPAHLSYQGNLCGMTTPVRKLSISVPPDVADHLEQEPNVSAYVTQAVRDRMRLDALDTELAHAGIPITDQGVAAARARRAAVEAEWPADRRQAARDRVRQHLHDDATGTTGSQQPAA